MSIDKIILQLNEDDFLLLSKQLTENRADKFLALFNYYREGAKLSEPQLLKSLGMNNATFYTLKSRLLDKIQNFLYKNTDDIRIELLKNVANIESLIYKTPPETAIGLLKKLEAELIEHDMPNELIIVYKALKKLNIHSKKYYDYSQLYNKHVAFNLAQDKAEELLSLFCKTQGEYFLSRDPELLNMLVLYKKEMINVCRLYQSHHLKIYKNILLIHFAIFSPVENEMQDGSTVEEMLQESLNIIQMHPEDKVYRHLKDVINFLYFEYYHSLKLTKNAGKYFERITSNTSSLLLFNHCSFVYHFLVSKVEFQLQEKKESSLYLEPEMTDYKPNPEDMTGYILFSCYKAVGEFYAKNYTKTIQILVNLLNEVSFKRMLFVEAEIKSFLALLYLLTYRHQQAVVLIRSIVRKIRDENDDPRYESALAFIKIIKMGLNTVKTDRYSKIVSLYEDFNETNEGNYRFLTYLKIDPNILSLVTTGQPEKENLLVRKH
jgi:hypothetical protein